MKDEKIGWQEFFLEPFDAQEIDETRSSDIDSSESLPASPLSDRSPSTPTGGYGGFFPVADVHTAVAESSCSEESEKRVKRVAK